MGFRWQKIVASFVFTLLQISCITSSKTKTNSSGVEITIPDPDGDKDVPKFCNPTGKRDDELKSCFEHNETLYKSFDEEAKLREPWFNFAPDNWSDSTELDSRLVYVVKNDEVAADRLKNLSFVALNEAEVEEISGIKTGITGYRPYLVRALYYFQETGTFSVFEKSGSILVRHDSIGATTPKEIRTGVIVFLRSDPKNVYVDCQIAE